MVDDIIMLMLDQMDRIVLMKQKDGDLNEDFINAFVQEVQVFEDDFGGRFLWGYARDDELEEAMKKAKIEYKRKNKKEMNKDEEKDEREVQTRVIKEKILAIAILRRANKKRFENLLIKLHNDYLLGRDNYPATIAGTLR